MRRPLPLIAPPHLLLDSAVLILLLADPKAYLLLLTWNRMSPAAFLFARSPRCPPPPPPPPLSD